MPYKYIAPMPDDYMINGEFDELFFTDVEPVNLKIIENDRYHGHQSVCQKIRDIYMKTDNQEIKDDCRLAMAMLKRMHQKLKWYRDTFQTV